MSVPGPLWTPAPKLETAREWPRAELRSAYEGLADLLARRVGDWPVTCPYTGARLATRRVAQIEHVIPLEWAARSGADAWPKRTWREFAGHVQTLALVSPEANERKGDRGPADWLPDLSGAHYWYAATWAAGCMRWGLSLDRREIDALRDLLGHPGGRSVSWPDRGAGR